MPSIRDRDFKTLGEYMDAHRKLGSCGPQFKETMARSLRFGAAFGVPFGLYVAYRQHGLREWRAFPGKMLVTWISSVLTFGVLGVMGGTYNCLVIKKVPVHPPDPS